MAIGKQLRLRRFMGSGRSVIVAVDHGNTAGVVPGLENPVAVVKTIAHNGADGILVSAGILEQVVDVVESLAIVLRIDGCTSIRGGGPMRLYIDVEQACRLGVDGVVVNATIGSPYESEELKKLGEVCAIGRGRGMPVLAEMQSQRMLSDHRDLSGKGDPISPLDLAGEVAMASRIGAELGADAIETRYSGDIESFRRIVLSTGRPVLVAGGPFREAGLADTLHLVDEVLEAGASGVVFGRNIWQQPDPAGALRAVSAMVHEDATIDEALAVARL